MEKTNKRPLQHSPDYIEYSTAQQQRVSPESKKTKNSGEALQIHQNVSASSSQSENSNTEFTMDSECSQFLNSLNQNNNPNINDVIKGIALILSKMQTNHNEIISLSNRVNQHDSDIESVKENVKNNSSNINDIQGDLNLLQQHKIDDEAILCGFPRKLTNDETTYAVSNLCKQLNIEKHSIRYSYSFKSNETQNNGYLIIKFADKSFQINFIKQLLEKGFPLVSQIFTGSTKDDTSIIRCYGRLTKANMDINKGLRQLKELKLIKEIRYRNCCFQYKKSNESNFISVKSIIELKLIKKSLNA